MKHIILFLSLVLSLTACGPNKTPSKIKDQSKLEKLTPNIAYLVSSYDQAWETTLKVLQYDMLLPVEHKDKEKGFFSTILIKEYDESPARRFRITGDLSSNNAETMIKIYKHEEFKDPQGTWQAMLPDLKMESEIVQKIKETLSRQ